MKRPTAIMEFTIDTCIRFWQENIFRWLGNMIWIRRQIRILWSVSAWMRSWIPGRSSLTASFIWWPASRGMTGNLSSGWRRVITGSTVSSFGIIRSCCRILARRRRMSMTCAWRSMKTVISMEYSALRARIRQ